MSLVMSAVFLKFAQPCGSKIGLTPYNPFHRHAAPYFFSSSQICAETIGRIMFAKDAFTYLLQSALRLPRASLQTVLIVRTIICTCSAAFNFTSRSFNTTILFYTSPFNSAIRANIFSNCLVRFFLVATIVFMCPISATLYLCSDSISARRCDISIILFSRVPFLIRSVITYS